MLIDDQIWLKELIIAHFRSPSHLAQMIKVSKQYIYRVLHGDVPLSKRCRSLISEIIVQSDENKKKLPELEELVTLSECNHYLKRKFDQTFTNSNFIRAVKLGKIDVIEQHYGKNGKYLIKKESLEKFRFKFKRI